MVSFALMNTRRRIGLLLVWLLCWIVWSGCDNGQQGKPAAEAPGRTLAFQLEWPQRTATGATTNALSGNVCEDFMIETVAGSLYDSDDALVETKNWECVDRSGTFTVKFGSGYRVTIQGIVAGDGLWQGQATGIEVVEGVTNDPIVIQMAYVGDDTDAPVVQHVSPADGTGDVPVVAPLSVALSEPIVKGSLDATNFTLASDAGPHPCDFAYEAGNQSVTITPRGKLAPSTTYRAHIAVGGAIQLQDIAGNPLAADYEWSFTTGLDTTTPPVVQSVSPANGTTVVSMAPTIKAVFDQPMDNQTIVATNMILRDSGSNAVAGEVTYNAAELAAVFTPQEPLQVNSAYTVLVTSNVTNADGVPMAAEYTWSFNTTASVLSLVQPTDAAIVPCDTVLMEWSEVTGSVGYHLQVSASSTFDPLLMDVMVTGTQYTLDSAAIGANYWRVRAQDSSQNEGAWTAAWQFTGSRTRWYQRFGSPGEDDTNGMAITQDNGIVITGRTWGVVDLPGSDDTYTYQGGGGDVFLLKLDENGNGVWLESLGSEEPDEGDGVAIDAQGDIYITGFSDGDFGAKQTDDSQILFSKFSSNGNLRWARQFGENRSEYGQDVATILQNGSVLAFVTGYTDMALTDIDPSGDNIFLARFDAAGNQQSWLHTGTAGMDRGYSVLPHSSGDAIVTGGEDRHLVAISFAPDGQRNWKADFGETILFYPYLAGTIEGDDLYVTSTHTETGTTDRKPFLTRFNATDGQEVWTKFFEITAGQWTEYGETVAVDLNGDIYVAGIDISDNDISSLYVAKFEPDNGDLLWYETFGGDADPFQYGQPKIDTDSQGNVVVAARSFEAGDNYGTYEIFVWKITGRDQ